MGLKENLERVRGGDEIVVEDGGMEIVNGPGFVGFVEADAEDLDEVFRVGLSLDVFAVLEDVELRWDDVG